MKGLSYMHSKRIIHFDLKPDNILLTADDQIKICDFGLSITTKSVIDRYRSGDSSLYHIAPELKENNTPSPNVDLYSFGIVLFEMCFGPLQSRERRDLLEKLEETTHIAEKYMHQRIHFVFHDVMSSQILNIF